MDNVTIVRSQRRSSVAIKIEPDASITVIAPTRFPMHKIEELLEQNADWIEKKRSIMQTRIPKTSTGERKYFYLGKEYELSHKSGQKQLVEVGDKLYVASTNSAYRKTYLTSWYKQQARKIIVERVYHYAKILDLSFKSISITSAETRWGSCSSEKSLNFNWKLVMAPLTVIDYVVTHELAHLVEMNHSRDFWETVRKMYPLYREYRLWLKRYGHTLTV